MNRKMISNRSQRRKKRRALVRSRMMMSKERWQDQCMRRAKIREKKKKDMAYPFVLPATRLRAPLLADALTAGV